MPGTVPRARLRASPQDKGSSQVAKIGANADFVAAKDPPLTERNPAEDRCPACLQRCALIAAISAITMIASNLPDIAAYREGAGVART